ncbi:hypothetical protein E4U53_007498 [Claviceps sorghi]|nr:hypothetical protein E4U53_007498 [Claviceps sorghi]
MSGQSSPLNATFEGHIGSTLDALMLFEACLTGELNHVPRRPHDRERPDLIKSGNIFVYEEHASGIKRWTDGVSWSPSRILGNFLIYRELEKPFPPGEKKRALKKKKSPAGGIGKPEPSSHSSIDGFALASLDTSSSKDTERALIGSLVDSYPFKKNGLVKKTISITHQGVPHHMVSYYNVSDVVSGRLTSPTRNPSIQNIIPRPELVMSQNFRTPIDEVEFIPEERSGTLPMYNTLPNAHDFGNGSGSLPRTLTLPSCQPLSMQPAYGTSGYGYNPHSRHNYTPAISSSMLPPMSQPLSSSMALPPLSTPGSHVHHSATSLQPSGSMPMPSSSIQLSSATSLQPSGSTPMPASSTQLSYATHQQGNYSLDHQKTARYGSDSGLAHTFPRNMPTQDCSRRNSAYEVSQPSDLPSLSLCHVTDGRQASNGSAYMGQTSYYLPPHPGPIATPENPVFSHHRPIKVETDLSSVEDGSQHFDLDENNSAWGFEGIDSSQGQQYFETQANGNLPNWHGGPSSVGRS